VPPILLRLRRHRNAVQRRPRYLDHPGRLTGVSAARAPGEAAAPVALFRHGARRADQLRRELMSRS
jgi:hypothetical protein